MSISFQRVALDIDAPVAHITLAHPPLNVIDIPMMDELSVALHEVASLPDISAIVFASSEKAFSAGVDVAAHTPDRINEMLTKLIAELVAPLIATPSFRH